MSTTFKCEDSMLKFYAVQLHQGKHWMTLIQ